MKPWTIRTDSYFDGEMLHDEGPYFLLIENDRLAAIGQGEDAGRSARFAQHAGKHAAFLMPGLVEAHTHLFLDGNSLEFAARSAYLKGPVDDMKACARKNVAAYLARGVTLLRDAGDKFGVNHAIRDEINAGNNGPLIRSPGLALHRRNCYGRFMARPIENDADIPAVVAETAETSDDLKIILTGIIDFDACAVKARVQFSVDELKPIIAAARECGLNTFAHCSGIEGIRIAVEAGIGSIEHGFFMDRAALEEMAKKEIAWVQTFSPVHFQWAHPEYAKWSPRTLSNLRRIVDDHLEHAAMAAEIGASLVAGSDAGSHGVRHGAGLIDELFFLVEAGVPMNEILTSATSRPRRLWSAPSNRIFEGETAEFVTLGASPFEQAEALRDVELVVREGRILHDAQKINRQMTSADPAEYPIGEPS